MDAIDPTVFNLIVFALAIFVGYYVVWSVTPALQETTRRRRQSE